MSKALAEPITEAWIDLMLVFALQPILSRLVFIFGLAYSCSRFDDALLPRLNLKIQERPSIIEGPQLFWIYSQSTNSRSRPRRSLLL